MENSYLISNESECNQTRQNFLNSLNNQEIIISKYKEDINDTKKPSKFDIFLNSSEKSNINIDGHKNSKKIFNSSYSSFTSSKLFSKKRAHNHNKLQLSLLNLNSNESNENKFNLKLSNLSYLNTPKAHVKEVVEFSSEFNINFNATKREKKESEYKKENIPSLKQMITNNKKAPTKLFLKESLINKKNFFPYPNSTKNNSSIGVLPLLLNSAKKINEQNSDHKSQKYCKEAHSYSTMSWEYSEKPDKIEIVCKQNSNSLSNAKIVEKLSSSLEQFSSGTFGLKNSNNDKDELKEELKDGFKAENVLAGSKKKVINLKNVAVLKKCKTISSPQLFDK